MSKRDENMNHIWNGSDEECLLRKTQNQTPPQPDEKLEALEKQVIGISRDLTRLFEILDKKKPFDGTIIT